MNRQDRNGQKSSIPDLNGADYLCVTKSEASAELSRSSLLASSRQGADQPWEGIPSAGNCRHHDNDFGKAVRGRERTATYTSGSGWDLEAALPASDTDNCKAEIVLPAASRALRNVPAASTGHCTGSAILGDGDGIRFQAESWLELCLLFFLNAMMNVADLQEQVRFFYGCDPKDPSQHVFDVVATLTCRTRIAFAIKPEARLVSGRFSTELQEVAWWVDHKRFADEVRLITDADVNPVDLHNARIFATARVADPYVDDAALQTVASLRGARSLRDLTHDLGMAARGYRAMIRLMRNGFLRTRYHEKITPNTLIMPKEAF